jgi:C-terminal processing protease CtpA/Prc
MPFVPMKLPLIPLLLLASIAAAQDSPPAEAPVQMAPVTVKAGPLGFIGIRCSVSVGLFAFVSSDAHIKDLEIIEVFKDSSAERAGIRAQDHILQIDGISVTDYSIGSLRKIGEKEKGDTIELQLSRPGEKEPRTVVVTLGSRKAPPK